MNYGLFTSATADNEAEIVFLELSANYKQAKAQAANYVLTGELDADTNDHNIDTLMLPETCYLFPAPNYAESHYCIDSDIKIAIGVAEQRRVSKDKHEREEIDRALYLQLRTRFNKEDTSDF